MGVPKPPLCLQVMINVFGHPAALGNSLADWMEQARKIIASPLIEEMQRRAASRSPSPISTEFGAPGDLWVALDAQGVEGTRTKLYEYNEKNWRRLLNQLQGGQLRYVNFRGDVLDELGTPTGSQARFTLRIDLTGVEFPGSAHSIQAWATDTLFPGHLPYEIQDRWVNVAKNAAVWSNATSGYITLDHLSFLKSPYEKGCGIRYGRTHAEYQEFTRGYYWGNFLSGGHVRKLGGLDRIRSDSPCDVVEDLSGGRGDLVYLQLTPDVQSVSDDALRALRDYFEPLLPPPRPGYEYIGPPLRLV